MNAAASLWLAEQPLILASRSAIRRQMLEAAGLPVEVASADVDERALEDAERRAGAGPAEVALALAIAKARAVSVTRPGRLVLGADQTLDLEGEALHKPTGLDAAAVQLRRLAGRSHALHSAAALVRDGQVMARAVDSARLTMRPLDSAMIARYLAAAGEGVLGSVGAYQLEGLGVHLFARIEGDHFTILGLPLTVLLDRLRELGAVAR